MSGLPENLDELRVAVRKLAKLESGGVVGRPFHTFQGVSSHWWGYTLRRALKENEPIHRVEWVKAIHDTLEAMDKEVDSSVVAEIKRRPDSPMEREDFGGDPELGAEKQQGR